MGYCVKRNWTDEELTECWLLSADELALLPNRIAHNRLGFAVHLKFFQIEGRFPRSPREIPVAAVCFLADQLGLSPTIFQKYDWRGRARKHHRSEIRAYLDFRPFTADDISTLEVWLRRTIIPSDQSVAHLHEAVLDWCREHRIEPPAPKRIERMLRSTLHRYETEFFKVITQQLTPTTCTKLDALLQPIKKEDALTDVVDEPEIVATVFRGSYSEAALSCHMYFL